MERKCIGRNLCELTEKGWIVKQHFIIPEDCQKEIDRLNAVASAVAEAPKLGKVAKKPKAKKLAGKKKKK